MEITVEIDQTKIQSEVQAELLNQETSGHCSRTEENKVEELIFDEEINFQYPSSVDSDTDGSSKNPHDYAITLQKNATVGAKIIDRPSTARTLKFVNKNKSTKLGFGYRPNNELIEEQELPATDDDSASEQDSDVSQDESVENEAPVAKRRKISVTTVPERRSSRVANLKMSNSMTQRGRSRSKTMVTKPASKSMPTKKRRATSRKRTRSNARSRSRSKSARSKARKTSRSTKSTPMKRKARKRRRRASKK